jgi:hypothetical protein
MSATADRLVKPKTARGRRAVLSRAPRTVETLKRALLLHSGRTSATLKALLNDLGALKAHECLKLSRKNEGVRPFEAGGEASLEFLSRKADCALFALASHSKKRPDNLILGRTFDARLLDMVEFGVRAAHGGVRGAACGAAAGCAPQKRASRRALRRLRARARAQQRRVRARARRRDAPRRPRRGAAHARAAAAAEPSRRRRAAPRSPHPARAQVENFKAIREFGGVASRAARGSKPCIVFLGDGFETDAVRPSPLRLLPAGAPLPRALMLTPLPPQVMRLAKSLLLDFFRGRVVPNVNLKGLDRVIIATAVGTRILLRQCATRFKKSGAALPRVELTEMGPRLDLRLRRHREAPEEARKAAMAAAAPPKRAKNVGADTLVGKVGRVFVPPQEVETLALSKPKGVRRGRREAAAEAKAASRRGGQGGGGGGGDDSDGGAGGAGGGAGEGGGGGGRGRAGGGRKRAAPAEAEAPAGGLYGSHQASEGNLTAGKGLKKPKRAKRAAGAPDGADD